MIRVDLQGDQITKWGYENKSGFIESVQLSGIGMYSPYVKIKDSVESTVVIYVDDIPNLIKALQAAYNCAHDYKHS